MWDKPLHVYVSWLSFLMLAGPNKKNMCGSGYTLKIIGVGR